MFVVNTWNYCYIMTRMRAQITILCYRIFIPKVGFADEKSAVALLHGDESWQSCVSVHTHTRSQSYTDWVDVKIIRGCKINFVSESPTYTPHERW